MGFNYCLEPWQAQLFCEFLSHYKFCRLLLLLLFIRRPTDQPLLPLIEMDVLFSESMTNLVNLSSNKIGEEIYDVFSRRDGGSYFLDMRISNNFQAKSGLLTSQLPMIHLRSVALKMTHISSPRSPLIHF